MSSLTMTADTAMALARTSDSGVQKSVEALRAAGQEKDAEKIDEAAREFEAVFVSAMLQPMFEGIKPDDTFGGGKGEEMFQSLMLSEYGKIVAKTGQLGIADHVKAEMIRMQEGKNR
jgi:flagellar protein FlgJ